MGIIRLVGFRRWQSPSLSNHPARRSLLTVLALFVVIIFSTSAVAATLNVPAGGDLQAALNAAQPGDTVVLEAGASFTGTFTLPNKDAATDYITVRTSTPDSPQMPAAVYSIAVTPPRSST